MKTAIYAISYLFLLSACVTANPTYLPDGTMGHSISCGGAARTIAACYEKAGELCGSAGFTVINQQSSSTPFAQSQGGFTANSQTATGGFASTYGAIIQRNLLVKCGK